MTDAADLQPVAAGSAATATRPGADADTDAEEWGLVARIGRGDEAALATLYRRHYARLCRFVFRITADAGDVDDIVNEVMLVVWQKAATVVPRSRATTWILGIAWNKAVKARERARRSAAQPLTDELAETLGGADAGLARLETEQMAAAVLARLPVEQRAVMELVYNEGLNYADIAQILQCPENTVKTRMFHARRRLRDAWHEAGGSRPVDDGTHGGP